VVWVCRCIGGSLDRWIVKWLDRTNRYCNWRDISCADIVAQGGDHNGRWWPEESPELISKPNRKHLRVTRGLGSIHSTQSPLQISSQLNQIATLNWIFIFIRPINTSHTNSPPFVRHYQSSWALWTKANSQAGGLMIFIKWQSPPMNNYALENFYSKLNVFGFKKVI